MIKIVKVDAGFDVQATPPHVNAAWRSEVPMSAESVVKELLDRGAHQTDIGDALYAADPEWLKK